MVSGYSTSTSISRVDGLSTGPPGYGLEGHGLRPSYCGEVNTNVIARYQSLGT